MIRDFQQRNLARTIATTWSILLISSCTTGDTSMDANNLSQFATEYTAAWNSQNPARVAAHYAEDGSLKINDGTPSIG